jgi:hypothetical protein
MPWVLHKITIMFFLNFVKPWWQKGNMYFLDVIIFAFPCFSSSNLQRSCEWCLCAKQKLIWRLCKLIESQDALKFQQSTLSSKCVIVQLFSENNHWWWALQKFPSQWAHSTFMFFMWSQFKPIMKENTFFSLLLF